MITIQRQEEILRILQEKKTVTGGYLAELLYVSLPTIRRDLAKLESQGLVQRSHGGVRLNLEPNNEIPIQFRNTYNKREKFRLCKAAARLVREGDVVFMDGSTTVLPLIGLLKDIHNLTVITNGVHAAVMLGKAGIRAYSTGGELIECSMAFAGPIAQKTVRGFNADVCFFSSSGLSEDGWISDYSEAETALRRAMIENAGRSVFLCDSSKIGRRSAFNLMHLEELTCAVVGQALPKAIHTGECQLIIPDSNSPKAN